MPGKHVGTLPRKVRLEALRLRETGLSYLAIAAKCRTQFKRPVSEAVVRKWVKEHDADASPEPASESAEAPTPEGAAVARSGGPTSPRDENEPAEVNDDTIAELRGLVAEQKSLGRRAKAEGNSTAAARAFSAAGKAAEALARLEAKRRDASGVGEGAVVLTKEEYAAAERSILDRVARIAADLDRTGGIACGHCGRKIRIRLAKGE
jgi:hypothetical protein